MSTYVEINDGQDCYCIAAADALARMEQGDGWAEFSIDLDGIGEDVVEVAEPTFRLTLRPDWGGMWHLTDLNGIGVRLRELETASA